MIKSPEIFPVIVGGEGTDGVDVAIQFPKGVPVCVEVQRGEYAFYAGKMSGGPMDAVFSRAMSHASNQGRSVQN